MATSRKMGCACSTLQWKAHKGTLTTKREFCASIPEERFLSKPNISLLPNFPMKALLKQTRKFYFFDLWEQKVHYSSATHRNFIFNGWNPVSLVRGTIVSADILLLYSAGPVCFMSLICHCIDISSVESNAKSSGLSSSFSLMSFTLACVILYWRVSWRIWLLTLMWETRKQDSFHCFAQKNNPLSGK